MRASILLSASTCALTSLAAATVASAAVQCPLKVDEMFLFQQGQTLRADRYVMRLSSALQTASSANVTIMTSGRAITFPIDLKAGDTGPTFVVTIPHEKVGYAFVDSWGKGSARTRCDDPAHTTLVPPLANPVAFDDAALHAIDLTSPPVLTVIDATMTERVQPSYPKADVYSCHMGSVRVDYVIGPGGTMLRAVIGQSSGFQGLDDAALTAARASKFSEPHLEDKTPLTLDYSSQYDFAIPEDFRQRAGLHCPG